MGGASRWSNYKERSTMMEINWIDDYGISIVEFHVRR